MKRQGLSRVCYARSSDEAKRLHSNDAIDRYETLLTKVSSSDAPLQVRKASARNIMGTHRADRYLVPHAVENIN
jgi:hypothetical protein